jgi:hypothetical protein
MLCWPISVAWLAGGVDHAAGPARHVANSNGQTNAPMIA